MVTSFVITIQTLPVLWYSEFEMLGAEEPRTLVLTKKTLCSQKPLLCLGNKCGNSAANTCQSFVIMAMAMAQRQSP